MNNDFLPQNFNSEVNEEEQLDRVIWSTAEVERITFALNEGYKVKGTPFYEGNFNYKKANIVFEYTEKEMSDIKRCATDILYFAENFATVMTDNGLQRIKLRDYQKAMLLSFVDNRFSICLASRQVGKTICSAIFIAWYLLFNFDKNALILSNKGGTTKEILDKAKAIIENLPFFLKPGILKNDVMNMKFDNGCRIVGQSTTGKAGIGFTIHLLFLDEFAHIHHSFINSFYENVYPTLSSSRVSRIIITSTPNGYNKFFEIYDAADRGVNEFAPFRVDWWQVPGRDEKWKEQEVKNLGSEEAFNRQYGNQFMASSNLLLSGASIKKLKTGQKKFEHVDFEELEKISIDTSRCLFVSPEYENEDFKDRTRYWVFCVDLAEGIGGDYSVINIFEILPMAKKDFNRVLTPSSVNDFFAIKQAIVFRSNEHSIEEISKVLYTFCVDIFYQENVKIVIEYNTYGSTVINHMATIFPQRNEFDEEMVVKFKHRHDAANTKFGLKIKKDNKPIFCQNLKKYVEQNKMIITDEITIKELSSFGRTPTGTYVGQMGHDDHVMTCVSATEFFATLDFSDFVEELLDIIDEDLYEIMEAELEKTTKDKDGNIYYDIYDII
jgi:hypothetical protein